MKKSGPEGGHPRSPTDVDRLVGENVRRRRIQRNLTLSQLSAELGISHQQLQKYETGANRLSAGMLCTVAAELGVSIESLFEGEEAAGRTAPSRKEAALQELRSEGQYWLGRVQSEPKLRQMIEVLKTLSSDG